MPSPPDVLDFMADSQLYRKFPLTAEEEIRSSHFKKNFQDKYQGPYIGARDEPGMSENFMGGLYNRVQDISPGIAESIIDKKAAVAQFTDKMLGTDFLGALSLDHVYSKDSGLTDLTKQFLGLGTAPDPRKDFVNQHLAKGNLVSHKRPEEGIAGLAGGLLPDALIGAAFAAATSGLGAAAQTSAIAAKGKKVAQAIQMFYYAHGSAKGSLDDICYRGRYGVCRS